MKKVLWISRHDMTEGQKMDLERIMKDKVFLIQWTDTVKEIEEISPVIQKVDAVAAVLPLDLLTELVKKVPEKMVMQSVSGRIKTGKLRVLAEGKEESEFQFQHMYWQQIIKLELVTKRL